MCPLKYLKGQIYFNPRFPRGKRRPCCSASQGSMYFNPRFPRGKRHNMNAFSISLDVFQSTLPAGEATAERGPSPNISTFQSTLPAGEATLRFVTMAVILSISIHASRGGSDVSRPTVLWSACNFNPRFPRGKRPTAIIGLGVFSQFQSTLPAGEATLLPGLCMFWKTISIHASRGGSDTWVAEGATSDKHFNPRFPRGKRLRMPLM